MGSIGRAVAASAERRRPLAVGALSFQAYALKNETMRRRLLEANDRIYEAKGLAAARAALRPGGVLAVWSPAPDAGFVQRLRGSGYAVEEKRERASTTGRGARHVIWLATPR